MANPGVKNKEMQLMFFGSSKKKELHPTIA
jgi:hypothetical protein